MAMSIDYRLAADPIGFIANELLQLSWLAFNQETKSSRGLKRELLLDISKCLLEIGEFVLRRTQPLNGISPVVDGVLHQFNDVGNLNSERQIIGHFVQRDVKLHGRRKESL